MFDFSEPKFWVAAAFVLLVSLSCKKVAELLFSVLDKRAAKIKSELDAAKQIRAEAEEALALYKQKQLEFAKESENILAKARSDAETNNAQAQAALKIALDARLKHALEKIAQEEANAIAEVRNHIVDIALSTARAIISEQMTNLPQEELIKLAISDIEHKIH
jgi:F-type H+-transporting ATPase subunit b